MVGGWRRVAVGGWRLVAVGSWPLVAVGGWRSLAVGGWWSLGAVLKGCPSQKKLEFLRTALPRSGETVMARPLLCAPRCPPTIL